MDRAPTDMSSSQPQKQNEKPSSKKKGKSHFRVYFIEPENSILTQWCWVFFGFKTQGAAGLRPRAWGIPGRWETEIAAWHLSSGKVVGFALRTVMRVNSSPSGFHSSPKSGMCWTLFGTDVNKNAQSGPWVRLEVACPPARIYLYYIKMI